MRPLARPLLRRPDLTFPTFSSSSSSLTSRSPLDVPPQACLYVLNKIDAISIEELDLLYRIPDSVPISAKDWLNIDECVLARLSLPRDIGPVLTRRPSAFALAPVVPLVAVDLVLFPSLSSLPPSRLIETMWDKLALNRIYTMPRGVKAPDYSSPVVLRRSQSTVEGCVLLLPSFS